MPVTLQSSSGIERYTTKERIELYSGVPEEEIPDMVVQDAEDWVESSLRTMGVDPAVVDLPNANLRNAATWYSVYLLSKVDGGKRFKINATTHTSIGLGEITETLRPAQFTRKELPTTDFYGLAQRSMGLFEKDMLDNTKVSTKRFMGVSASTTDIVASTNYKTTGQEEYGYAYRNRLSGRGKSGRGSGIY